MKTNLTVTVLSLRVCCLPPTYGDTHAQRIKAVISLPWISSGDNFPLYSLLQSQRIIQTASPVPFFFFQFRRPAFLNIFLCLLRATSSLVLGVVVSGVFPVSQSISWIYVFHAERPVVVLLTHFTARYEVCLCVGCHSDVECTPPPHTRTPCSEPWLTVSQIPVHSVPLGSLKTWSIIMCIISCLQMNQCFQN